MCSFSFEEKLRGVGGMTTALRAGGEFRPRLEAVSEMSGGRGGGGETISMAAVPEGATPLMYACQQSRVNELANMINAKPANIRDRDRTLKTALHYCAENQKPDCAELLVSAAPDLVDARDEDGYTPLHLAVISGNIGFVRFLLGRGASLAALDNERHSVVHWATVCGELEALQTVLEAGAEASSPDMHGGYPVHYAAQMCGPGSEPGGGGGGGGEKSVGMSVLTALLDHKVPVNVTDKDGRQPILWAASAGSADAILALVNAGANVEADDKDGLTALHCAASRGHTECLETLITLCGAQVDLMDSNGCTALFYAATLGHADATQLLLTLNAQPNRQDRKGRTPAHCGAAKGQLETLRLLSEHDADLWIRNAKGDYALHEAVASGRKELVTWLLAQRPDAVNAANNDSRCPLHIAAIYNNVQMCKILLDAESLVNPVTRSSKGQLMTPLDAALYKGNRGCAKYLQLHGGVPATKLTPEAAALRGVANKTEVEQREGRSRGATPDMLNVPKGKQREARSLQTSPVTITGNKQLTLVDAAHNSHILQVHVQDQLSVMGDESHEVSESGAERRTKKRRHKRHSRRTDDDDYASADSDSRDRRRRRRRDDESSEEDEEEEDGEEEEEEGSGSRGGRKRRGGRREKERTDGSDYESDESEHSRRGRRRKDKNRRSKKERRSLRRERSDELNDGDDQKRRSTKGRERKRVIKEETKRSEIIKSKKVIEESMDDDESAPVTKSSITTSEERKEQTLKTVSEVVDGVEVPTESEKTGEERVVQVVEAEVHQEQQNEEDTQDGRASKTDIQTDDQGESTTAEGESSKKGNRKSKLKKMDKEEIASKQSESQKSEGAAAASATEDDNEAAERAAKLEEQRKSEEEEEERKRQEEEEEKKRLEEEEERRRREEEEEEQRRSEEEEERKAREEAERLAKEEAERKAKEEAERRAREEEERKAKEEAERIAREEAERKAREEAEEAEKKAKEEAERIAREEAERKAREEAERKAQEEAERKALEEQKHGRLAVEVKKYEDVKTVIENMKGDAETEDKAAVGNEPVTEEEVNKTTIQTTESAPPQEVVESEDTEADRSEVSMLKTPRSPSVQSSPRTPERATPRRRSNRLAAEMKKYEDVKTVVGNMKSHIQVANDKHNRMAVEVKKYEDVKTVIESMKGEEEYEEEEGVVKRSPRRGKTKDGERKKVRSKSRDRKQEEEEGGGGEQKRKASGKKKEVRVNEGGKTKREVNVSMDKIVDETNAEGGNEEQEDEEEDEEEFYSEKTVSGDEESVDLDPGRALVKIIGRAREEREPRSRRRRRKMSGDRPARARSSFSVVSDSLSTHLDSGFEPSPRNDRVNEARDRRRDRSAGPELTPASVTQAVQHSIRRYHLERRIFHELLELKRLQIRAGRSNEAVLVKRLAEEYRKAALDVGLIPYQGPFSFRTFENYLYDQLRKLQIAERKMVPKLQSNDELERLTAALRKTRAGKAFLESVPDSPAYCTHSTHRCSHATHAYTGIPCAAYITKANHHTVPKPPRSGFLPKIEAPDKRSKEGQSAEIARCLRYVDPSRPVTLELSHGKDRQVISLPTENLDKNKRYYVTFTIKGGESASETTGDERKHRHAKSF
ncbi:hypothetical protein LSTR_LSTR001264 [Laodelphax striatellus]|uniref:Uncharacterized protein n=1 Tax=Laodelphax striatellus TaxID=195883 RepID=A0A482XBG9_LAOST|nr:hypothetical protein LSTR_LSTR001264 [Laodelphax striatellus]